MTLDPKLLDDLARKLADAVPPGFKDLKADLERNFRAMLQTALGKLDLVTREEFDVQAGVLSRTRAKLEELSQRLAELETALAAQEQERSNKH
ncbi:MAG TPA: accessory factor UbiK family protein [Gammaproteobacteria bacterium]|nr:accessory factor UbiK family protein [Gammaproteobacteria bacterium]HEV2211999.1 accessory factor UbiK family protein [Gammaproteobacteria bacterium]